MKEPVVRNILGFKLLFFEVLLVPTVCPGKRGHRSLLVLGISSGASEVAWTLCLLWSEKWTDVTTHSQNFFFFTGLAPSECVSFVRVNPVLLDSYPHRYPLGSPGPQVRHPFFILCAVRKVSRLDLNIKDTCTLLSRSSFPLDDLPLAFCFLK